jgi:MFS family permease
MLAFGVFTYQQTQSAFWVASMTMLRMLPMALFGVLFGALAARISRRIGLLVSQAVLFVTALVLLAVSAAGALEVWHLAVASFISGASWAGDMPLRRAFIGDVVGPQRMGEAMALDAVGNNACRLAGPLVGGLLLAAAGMPAVFLLSTVLYLPVLVCVLRLSEHRATPDAAKKTSVATMLAGGFRAAKAAPALRATLFVTIVFNLFCWPALSMVPVIGHDRLALETRGIGVLASMDGMGSLLGAIVLTAIARRSRYGHLYVGGTLLFLATLPVFALSMHPLLTGSALVVIGLGQSGFAAMQSTLVFVTAPPERRLEAMGLLTMCIGIAPLGFLWVGWLAERLGAPAAIVTCSLCGIASLLLGWRWWRACLGGEFS